MENADVPGQDTSQAPRHTDQAIIGCKLCGGGNFRSQYFSKGNTLLFVCTDCAYCWSVKYSQPPQTPKLESEFKAGEITAWRCWQIYSDGSYGSTSVNDVTWTFDNTIEGEPNNLAEGVHAWKTREQALSYGTDWFAGKTFAIGEVDLWGEVIEHEQGYRAQYAQMVSVEHVKMPIHDFIMPIHPLNIQALLADYDYDPPHWSIPIKAMVIGVACGALVYGGIGYVIWRAFQ